MQKTSIYLSQRERDRLARLSRQTGRSQSELVREAIARYEPGEASDREFALFDSAGGDGRSAADIPDEELLEGFGQ